MKRSKWTTRSIMIIILMCAIAGIYYFMLNRTTTTEEPVEASAITNVLARNLERNYPPTPKEVVKYFSEITQCFYNETYTDAELEKMAEKIKEIYDDELIANTTDEQYMRTLKSDIENFKTNQCVISSYATSASTDVDYFSQDGYDWARLYCVYTLRKGSSLGALNQVFILRKDADGHWKIYGWETAPDEEETSNE
ncbi:MAG: hypothetical protein PHP50_08590 [Lachnospiraceae bacterium]|nr:hypothetical protein [Lachnospiraceae bacterium]